MTSARSSERVDFAAVRGYQVLRKLADGSAAEVFLAADYNSQGRVVIEVIRPEYATDEEIYGAFRFPLALPSYAVVEVVRLPCPPPPGLIQKFHGFVSDSKFPLIRIYAPDRSG